MGQFFWHTLLLKQQAYLESMTPIYLITVQYLCGYNDYKKLSYRLGTARRESLPKIADMDVEMTT